MTWSSCSAAEADSLGHTDPPVLKDVHPGLKGDAVGVAPVGDELADSLVLGTGACGPGGPRLRAPQGATGSSHAAPPAAASPRIAPFPLAGPALWNQRWMALRSKVCPDAMITGSLMTCSERGTRTPQGPGASLSLPRPLGPRSYRWCPVPGPPGGLASGAPMASPHCISPPPVVQASIRYLAPFRPAPQQQPPQPRCYPCPCPCPEIGRPAPSLLRSQQEPTLSAGEPLASSGSPGRSKPLPGRHCRGGLTGTRAMAGPVPPPPALPPSPSDCRRKSHLKRLPLDRRSCLGWEWSGGRGSAQLDRGQGGPPRLHVRTQEHVSVGGKGAPFERLVFVAAIRRLEIVRRSSVHTVSERS